MQENQQKNKDSIICAICGSKNTIFFYSELNLTLRQCIDCKIVFVHPLPTNEEYITNLDIKYDLLANKYCNKFKKEIVNKNNSVLQKKKEAMWDGKKERIYQRDLKKIKKYLHGKNSENVILLDVGCGEGYFIREAIKNGFKCEGIEPSKMHIPQKELNFKIFNGFLETFKIKKKYDIITLLDVLEHTKYPEKELQSIRRIIKTDGLFMMRVPNLNWLILKEKVLRLFCILTITNLFTLNPQGIYAPHTHLYTFSEKSLRMLLEKCGFKVVGIEIINASHSDNRFKEIFYTLHYFLVRRLFRITGVNFAISLNVFAKCQDNR